MDANSGYTAGVAELLIQSHEGFIRLLPALPENWKTGSISGIIARGNVEVDMEWENGSLRKVGLLARQDCTVQLLHKSNEAKVGLIKNQKNG